MKRAIVIALTAVSLLLGAAVPAMAGEDSKGGRCTIQARHCI